MTALPAPDHCVVMGILNVTPDSFSDGGRFAGPDDAVGYGARMHAAGADLVDLGGESTRPGAERVDAAEEIRRVLPVLRGLVSAGIPVTVDTTRAVVAEVVLTEGALAINDVSGGLADPAMVEVVADAGCPWILMHWRGHSDRMADLAHYDDVVGDVRDELLARVDSAVAAGVAADRLVLDPGLGFAKTGAHNWALLKRLDVLLGLGFPVLLGASRKAFLGALLVDRDGAARPPDGRDTATAVITACAAAQGVWGVRVHDVVASLDAVRVVGAAPELTGARPR